MNIDLLLKYAQEYNRFSTGKIILGPPGIGKTYYINNQPKYYDKLNWIDADKLVSDMGINWKSDCKIEEEYTYKKIDNILETCKKDGFNIIGSLFWDYIPDAIVIPPLDIHIKYLKMRNDLNYSDVMTIRNYLNKHAIENNIPLYTNCEVVPVIGLVS